MMRCLAVAATRLFAAAMFIALGASKLAGEESMAAIFEAIGFDPAWRWAIGAIEIAAGVGLLVPRSVAVSAYALCFISFCALLAHLVSGVGSPAGAIALGLTTAVLTWTHREQLPALADHRAGTLQ